MEFNEFSDRTSCEAALLNDVVNQIEETLKQKKTLAMALAGGNTPKPFYEKLGKQTLDWSKIKVTLTDERWVDAEHEDSNENMLKQTLMQENNCEFFPLKNSEASPKVGQLRTAHMLKKNIPQLDFAILGMGDDGHFASVFPAMDNTQTLLDLHQTEPCLSAYPEGKPPRMSLTLAYLLKAKKLYLFITGVQKHQVFKSMQDPQAANKLPIYYLIHQTACPLSVYWSAS